MKTRYNLFVFALAGFLATACNNDNETALPERNVLKLAASSDSIVLEESKQDEDALTFFWNKAANLGADYSFSYLFQLDIADNDFQTATEPLTSGEDGTVSFKTGELYDLIVDNWKATAGETVKLEARVAAKVTGPKFRYPEIAYAKVSVKTFIPVSNPLYMLGTATEAGLDPEKGVRMNERSNGRIYDWKGKLKAGNLKFISRLGSMLPSYNKGENDFTLVERTDESQPDNYFEITQAGTYYIYLSKKNMTVSYKRALFDALYMVGTACTPEWDLNGTWDLDHLKTMKQDEVNPNIFTWLGALKEGELKILTEKEWNVPTFRPKVQDGSIDSEDVQLSTEPDYKWKITALQAGLYKITIDVENLKIKFEKQ